MQLKSVFYMPSCLSPLSCSNGLSISFTTFLDWREYERTVKCGLIHLNLNARWTHDGSINSIPQNVGLLKFSLSVLTSSESGEVTRKQRPEYRIRKPWLRDGTHDDLGVHFRITGLARRQ